MAGVTDWNLRLSYWFLSHKDQLKKWWVMMLIATDVLLVAFWLAVFLVVQTDGRALDRQKHQRQGTPLLQAAVRTALAKPLEIGTAVALPVDATHVELAVEVTNPNTDYAVEELTYRFSYGGKVLDTRRTFLMPGSRRFLSEANVGKAGEGSSPSLELVGVRWRRPPDPGQASRVHFVVSNQKFDPNPKTSTSPPQPAPRLTATIKNDSVYSFRSVEVSIGLRKANQLVAVNSVALQNWKSFSDQRIDLQWIGALPPLPEVVIVPQVNLLDDVNFILP